MRFDMSAIKQNRDRRPARGGQRFEDDLPDTLGGPAHEPIVERLARTELLPVLTGHRP